MASDLPLPVLWANDGSCIAVEDDRAQTEREKATHKGKNLQDSTAPANDFESYHRNSIR